MESRGTGNGEERICGGSSFKKFRAVAAEGRSRIADEVVGKTGTLAPGQRLPLVLRPLVPDADLADWAAANAETVESELLEHGAVLFRGFGIDSPPVLERFASTLCSDLFNENGEHPRESVDRQRLHAGLLPARTSTSSGTTRTRSTGAGRG